MSDLVKTVLGGAWSLVVGWVLPIFLALQLMVVLLAPDLSDVELVRQFDSWSWASRQLAILAVAAVAGLVLAAAQAPLYRLLEGYLLWPRWLSGWRTRASRRRRQRLAAAYEAEAAAGGVRAGLLYERAARYPAQDEQ